MANWLDDVANYLAAQPGFGKVGREITTAQFNQDADPCRALILVTPTAGQLASCAIDRPRIQIVTRSLGYVLAWERAWEVYVLLRMHGKATLGATLLVSCTAIQTPFPLGMDEQKCWRFACNYQLELGN